MDEYIEREAATNVACNILWKMNDLSTYVMAKALNSIPAADVAPVRHGRWVLELEPNGKPYCFHCSVCDDDFHYIGITVAYDYCPNCGAKMDGGEDW